MSGISVGLHPEAVEEAEAAVIWYARRSSRAAQRFVEELEVAVAAIAEAPDRWPRFDRETRRVILRRFPYIVIYRVLPDRVEILAVAHGRRRPGYWRGRADY
jgi:plasmid stabilization system protein ParE